MKKCEEEQRRPCSLLLRVRGARKMVPPSLPSPLLSFFFLPQHPSQSKGTKEYTLIIKSSSSSDNEVPFPGENCYYFLLNLPEIVFVHRLFNFIWQYSIHIFFCVLFSHFKISQLSQWTSFIFMAAYHPWKVIFTYLQKFLCYYFSLEIRAQILNLSCGQGTGL